MPRHYEKKEGTRRIMYRQDDIARAMIDVQEGMSIRAAATKNNEIQDLPELPDLEESFNETSSEFNIGDYVLVKFQQGKLKPYSMLEKY
ncbi:hypothetical protein Avbf_18913 [Armadillidium vulgare]|nr:hypothetical protein Avbf_18913 [Armadillidium vulgare]